MYNAPIPYEDSSSQRVIRLVQSADAGKAKIVGLADRWATWIVVIALTASAERFSEHPIGKAIVTSYKKSGGVPDAAADFQMIPGRGVCAGI